MKFCANGDSRRIFLKKSTALAALYLTPSMLTKSMAFDSIIPLPIAKEKISLSINGQLLQLEIDARITVLNLLREQIGLTGTKKGCEMGQCGACIIHINGKKVNSCLQLAVSHNGSKINTIEGLATDQQLHPLQAAFLKHDAFQCGYCTSGQIMSGVICIKEGHTKTRNEIKNFMSGNICRCGAYQNIVDAIAEVAQSGQKV